MRVVTRATLALAVVFAALTAYPAWRSIPWGTIYGAASPAAMMAQFSAGTALVAAALLWGLERPGDRIGLLLALTGMAWFLPVWVGWQNGPAEIRTGAALLEPLFLPLVCHVVVSICGGSVRLRAAIAFLYLLTAGLALTRLLVTDPLTDAACWNNCTVNLLLLSSQPSLSSALAGASNAVAITAGLALAAGGLLNFGRVSHTARRLTWLATIPSSLLGLALVAQGTAEAVAGPVNPFSSPFAEIFHLEAWSVVALSVGAASGIVRARRARRAAANLAVQLGAAPKPGSLGPVLARTTGDPTLEVAYWLPDTGRFVNESGRQVALPTTDDSRRLAQIVRQGELIAIINHDPALVDFGRLVQAIGPAARLAIDNERLQAELLDQLDALKASQVRIVETADAERRRLERNLHDAAQQAVLALSYHLRLVSAASHKSGSPILSALLQRATRAAQTAIEDLRALAHGMYPAVLTESGLGPALASLADAASIPVEVGAVAGPRLAPVVERTAYLVAADVIQQASDAGLEELIVNGVIADGDLIVEIRGADLAPSVAVADRVGAVGGRIIQADGVLRVELPCG